MVALGVTLPQFTDDPAAFVAAARRAEAAGLDSVWVFDHLWPLGGGRARPILEAFTALAWLAASTERVGLGTLVARSTLRHPVLLAKMVATVAAITPGRLTVGIGSGDERSRAENEAFGLPYHSGGARVAQLEEAVEVLRLYLTSGRVAFAGETVRVEDLAPSPAVATPPKVWVAGRGSATIRLAGRSADGWNGWALEPQAFAACVRQLRAAAGEREVEATWGGLALLADDDETARAAAAARRDPERYLAGGPERVAAGLRALVAAGAGHLVLTFPNPSEPGLLELLGGSVRPRLREP
jgi:alkanesulfonate monooxygenase SsuD/methylene tetrahydromethanopterin reductase-like flavin-dependent oxidoreductase (luciferase family)